MKEELKREHWSHGQLMYEIPCVNGIWHGLGKWWYSNGQLSSETPYKNNTLCGAKIVFNY